MRQLGLADFKPSRDRSKPAAFRRTFLRGIHAEQEIEYWRHERSSRLIRNLSNCEREAWKKFRLQRDSNPWPLRYRCSALPTELWSHNCWEQVNFSGSIMPLRVIQHYSDWVCTAVMSKWRHERSSRLIRNLSNCEREAWRKFRLQRDSNPWPLRYRCSALPTELWSHNCWEQVNFSGSIMPLRVIQHYSDWVCTAVMSKWRHERSSRLIRNLSNCEREAWRKFRLQRDSNPWPLRYRCSALPTELWSHNCWEQVNFSGSIMPLRVIQHYSDWVCTAVMSKWRHERSSRLIRNLSNCEREAWRKFRLQRDSNPWPLRYRCSALPTELWSHNCWEQVNFSGSIMPLRVIQHYSDWVCTAVMSKWRHERSSRLIRNLSNCEREAWKKFRLQRDSNPWPLRYRCSALPTELWSHNCWEQVNFSGSIMPLRVIQHYSDWVCTAVMSKWRHERSSRLIRNLSNCEREAWRKFRLQRDSNPWPLRYRCSALPTELWSHNCWEQVNFSGSIMPLRVIQHYSDWVCTAVMSKWRHERSSRLIRNLSNCEREAWKKFRLQRDSNPWPLRYRCSALPTELWSHNCWEQVNFSGSIMPLRVIQHYSDWVCTAVMSKWRHERSSRLIRNLSNCEREAWRKFRLQRDSNPWPLRYRCSALPTELWSHNCWEQVNFSGSIMPLRVIQHYSDWVCTAVMSKWRHERSSRLIRNLSNCEREAWKKFRLQRDSNPWPLRYRCSALPTELWSHNCWEQVNFSGSIMPLRVIQHYSDWVCTAVMSKWRHERSSRLIRNLSNCEREAWKKFRLQRDSNPWPLRYRCSALPTELWSHNCWEQVNFSGSIMPLRVIQHYSDWVCTAVMSKWRHERSSRLIRNLSNCEREAWRKFRLQRDSNPWPLRYRCSALPTELWSHNCWEQVNFSGSIMPLRVIQHYSDWVCTAVMSKWRHERSSRLIRNLSNCEREAWKKFRLQRDSNPWPLRYRCSALPTELWSHNCWEQVNFSGSIMPLRVIQHYSDWVCTAVMSKWRHERSSRLIRNLSNCEREAWKKFRLQRDSNPGYKPSHYNVVLPLVAWWTH